MPLPRLPFFFLIIQYCTVQYCTVRIITVSGSHRLWDRRSQPRRSSLEAWAQLLRSLPALSSALTSWM